MSGVRAGAFDRWGSRLKAQGFLGSRFGVGDFMV